MHLLRPNVVHPNLSATASLDTPPPTDFDYSSHPESDLSAFDSDLVSQLDSDIPSELDSDMSEAEAPPRNSLNHFLDDISEDPASSVPSSPRAGPIEADNDADESGNEAGLAESIDSLRLHPTNDLDTTLRQQSDTGVQREEARPSARQSPLKSRLYRSASSPSRSPARRMPRRPARRRAQTSVTKVKATLYEYIFS
jgi:hypothetical protein